MREERASWLWGLYTNGRDYLRMLGLPATVEKSIRFYEGKQWENSMWTRDMPKPMLNLVRFVCRGKRAKMVLTPVKLHYHCEAYPLLGARFDEVADGLLKKMRIGELDSRAVRDGLLKGSYCYHLYWADENGVEEAGLKCELIDPLHVFFSNPHETDEQKQEWIMISKRVPLAKVRELVEPSERELIKADREADEQRDSDLVTVLTRYFRVGDEVFVEQCTQTTMVKMAHPISPIDWREEGSEHVTASLYPLVFASYEERENSIYGISEAEGLISNQRIINGMLGMQALAIQNTAWGKYVVSKDALKGQEMTNTPGEVLVDYSMSGNGIRRLEHPSLSGYPMQYVEALTHLTRAVAGANEVISGENIGGLSGSAIARLQAQANMPIEEQRARFWRAKERLGLVLWQCARLYTQNEAWEEAINARMQVHVEATQGTYATTAGDVSLLETLFNRGAIDAVTLLEAYPREALTDKAGLLELLNNKRV